MGNMHLIYSVKSVIFRKKRAHFIEYLKKQFLFYQFLCNVLIFKFKNINSCEKIQ